MCKISKHAYKYQMKRQEEQRSTHGVYCSSARKHKLIYVTETKAQRAVELLEDDTCRTYYCKSCSGYHTTSKKKRNYLDDLYAFALEYAV